MKASLLKNPRPIIACNPDRYVMGISEKIKVAGYYAEKLAKECDVDIYWCGKPLLNFSKIVKDQCIKLGYPTPDKNTWFFDDNIENIISMKKHIGISGCCIKTTGLSKFENIKLAQQQHQGQLDAVLDTLAL